MIVEVWHYADSRQELIEVATRAAGQALVDNPAPGTFVRWHSSGVMITDGKRASYDNGHDDSWRYDGYRMRY